MVSDNLVQAVSEAIATAEGWMRGDDVPTRANNPGDLTDDGDVGNGTIQTGGPNGAKITIYSSPTDGWNALYRKVRRMLTGGSTSYPIADTIAQLAKKYSGDPQWGVNVAAFLTHAMNAEVTTETTLADLVAWDQSDQANWSAS